MKAFKVAAFAVVALSAAAGSAGGTGWFEAGVAGYEKWPTDGDEMHVPAAGVWRGTGDTVLSGDTGARRLVLDTSLVNALCFDLDDQRSIVADAPPSMSFKAMLSLADELPPFSSDAKGGIVPLRGMDGDAYWGLVGDSGTNVWSKLDGAVPVEDEDVAFTVDYRIANGETQVRYSVDGVTLGLGGDVWLPVFCATPSVERVSFVGKGEVALLSGELDGDIPAVALSVPDIAGMSLVDVTHAGTSVTPGEDGNYLVPSNALVAVWFSPKPGMLLDRESMVVRVDGTMDIPEEGRPRAVDGKDVLSITEIMASNGDTLRTANGAKGLDWVELHNAADFPVDLTGWYLSDNPDKKPSKWKKIDGSCIIPAGGYKIVWADKDYTDFADGEAWTPTGLSASGDPLFLANPEASKVKDAAVSIDNYGVSLKDVSIGVVAGVEGLKYFRDPTPGAANGLEYFEGPTAKVQFSEPRGYKTAAFDLVISCTNAPDEKIYYTLDGTSPTAQSILYTNAIPISRTTVVRAATLKDNTILQQDATATYLFLDDILTQDANPPAGFPANNEVNNQAMFYGMDKAIVANFRDRIERGFTNSINTVSLVIDPAFLFGASTGIYVNAAKHCSDNGREWERLAMVEQISPVNGASDEFEGSAGLRIRGAASRGSGYPKHSLRLLFKSIYGMSKLEHPLFGDEGTKKFDKIDLRTSQNFAWANGDSRETFIHEVFSRDCQRDLGQPYNRSRYVHLFLNGVYWGLYQTEERVDGSYAESYFGGDEDDYDVIRTTQPGYVTEAVSGSEDNWKTLWDIAVNQGFVGEYEGNYAKVIDEGLVNTTNLMAYMLISHYTADTDCPNALTLDNQRINNLNAFCNREGTGKLSGFIFNKHDAEWSLGFGLTNNTTFVGTEASSAGSQLKTYRNRFGPAELHYKLMQNGNYRRDFREFVRSACLVESGALTDEACIARFRARMAEIDDAICCESARWNRGDASRTRDKWLDNCENICIKFITGRAATLIDQYRAIGWYQTALDAIGGYGIETNALAAVVEPLVAENELFDKWLVEMAEGSEAVRNGLSSFRGGKDAMRNCVLANVVPMDEPNVEVEIRSLSIGADGIPTIGCDLKLGGEPVSHVVNGTIRVYRADSIGKLKSAPDVVELGRAFPVDAGIPAAAAAASQFFKIVLEP